MLISVEPRINDRIRVPEVRLVGPNGEQVGIVRIEANGGIDRVLAAVRTTAP
mgnify:CR=1 FL=1